MGDTGEKKVSMYVKKIKWWCPKWDVKSYSSQFAAAAA